ncbi:MAG: hypothetical protein POELPBGB_01544 [Bacteroidia bacterium]|nr:hypothetical protein [Bacteroidia bacterium]
MVWLSKCYFSDAAKSSKILILATNPQIFFGITKRLQMRSFFSFILFSVFLSLTSQAQIGKRFKFSTGYSSYLLETGTKVSPVHGLGITPQFNLWQPRSNFSVAFALPAAVGIHFRTKVLGSMFVFSDIPLMGEINYGHLATHDFRKWWGVFAGGGYTFQSVGTRWQYGANLSAGFRFYLFRQSFTLRYARFFGENVGDVLSHRLALEINLGRFLKDVATKNKLQKFERPFQ